MPDSYNRYRGSQYTNSVTSGNWADFIAEDLVAHIDIHYRTIRRAEGRGIAGHSMGGYGAIRLAMEYPGTFSALYGLSASLTANLPSQVVMAYAPLWLSIADWEDLARLSTLTFSHFQLLATTAAFTPNPDAPPFYVDFPFELQDGAPVIREGVFERFAANFLPNMLDEFGANLLQLRGIHLAVGTQESDIISGVPANQVFSQALTDAGIAHVLEEVEGDHLSYVGRQIEVGVLPFFSRLLDTSPEPTATPAVSWGKLKAQF
jgi:enterochelin esterase-like enzyme